MDRERAWNVDRGSCACHLLARAIIFFIDKACHSQLPELMVPCSVIGPMEPVAI